MYESLKKLRIAIKEDDKEISGFNITVKDDFEVKTFFNQRIWNILDDICEADRNRSD